MLHCVTAFTCFCPFYAIPTSLQFYIGCCQLAKYKHCMVHTHHIFIISSNYNEHVSVHVVLLLWLIYYCILLHYYNEYY